MYSYKDLYLFIKRFIFIYIKIYLYLYKDLCIFMKRFIYIQVKQKKNEPLF